MPKDQVKVAISKLAASEHEKDSAGAEDFVVLTDRIELQLVRIWEEILGLTVRGTNDDFFELGGQSLQAISLLEKIEDVIGTKVSLNAFYKKPTIHHLLHVIRNQAEIESWSPLVKLQAEGTHYPVFAIHPRGGNVICYVDLARSLGKDQPFYAIQAPEIHFPYHYKEQKPYASIEEMAAAYIKLIQSVQPEGPYFLCGYSWGGIIAFEIARQLKQREQRIALLFLIEGNLSSLKAMASLDNTTLWLKEYEYYLKNMKGETLEQLSEEEKLDYMLQELRMLPDIPKYYRHPDIRQYLWISQENLKAFLRYKPQVYPGRFVLIRTLEQPEGMSRELGWRGLTTEGLDIYDVPGHHYSVLRPPNFKFVAETMRQVLFTLR